MSARTHRRRVLAHTVAAIAATVLPAHPASSATAREHRVDIRNFVYEPAILRVRVGDRVVWTNLDIVPHTATAMDGRWDSGAIEAGQSVSLTVTADFASTYLCRYHPAMRARVEWD